MSILKWKLDLLLLDQVSNYKDRSTFGVALIQEKMKKNMLHGPVKSTCRDGQ